MRILFIIVVVVSVAGTARCQDPPAAPETPAAESATPPVAPAKDGDANPDQAKQAPAGDDLSVQQARLADRFKRLEEVVSRLAELSAPTDPRRAKLLREAIAQSRDQDLNVRFESIIKLLEEERLSVASTNQADLQKELDALLALLLKADRDKERSSQRDRVRQYLKKVGELIRQQKSVRARTEGGDELRELGDDQKRIAGDTGKLSGDIATTESTKNKPDADADGKNGDDQSPKKDEKEKDKADDKQSPKNEDGEKKPDGAKPDDAQKAGQPTDKGSSESPKSKPGEGKPSEGKPSDGKPSGGKPSKPGDSPPSDSKPSPGQPGSPGDSDEQEQQKPSPPQDPADRAAERLRAAQQQMEDALKKLKETERKGAANDQQKALKELERAKAELERILRQLREEEMEGALTQLSARFRKMLELQTAVYEGTVRVDRVPQADRDHDDEIEAARLGRQESQIVHEADKALLLLHEDGSSAAFPEAIEQMRDDMRQVAERLAAVKVGTVTQDLEKDIMAALEETIAAIEKAMKDLEKKRTPPGQQPAAGQQSEPPLVDKLAELKMIRSLQMRINLRTQRYGKMIEGEQADTPDLIAALRDLAERQQRVYRATADLQQGRND